MARYYYDRKALKGLTPFPFLGEVKTRTAAIEAAPATLPKSIYNPNILAKRLHPAVQHCLIGKVEDHGDAKSFTLIPDAARGTTEMAYFRASQYVSVALNIDGAVVHKPYTIRSNPKNALGTENTSYTLTIKRTNPAYASAYILDHWKEGDAVDISGPLGDFYYQDLRDAKQVIAIAGGSGITPFYSMAAAIVDGIEDFCLTILYGSRTSDGILLKKEIETLAAESGGKVKVIHDRKLDALEDLIEAANGKPILIAYWFKHDRERLLKRFQAVPIDRAEDIDRWNRGEVPVAIIHPASAGHGLNLQAGGNHLVWFGLTWSLELYQQCCARLYRQGQEHTVTIQHIMTRGTIDEDVLAALEKKDCNQEAIMAAVKARIGGNVESRDNV